MTMSVHVLLEFTLLLLLVGTWKQLVWFFLGCDKYIVYSACVIEVFLLKTFLLCATEY